MSLVVGGDTSGELTHRTLLSRDTASESVIEGKEGDVSSWPQVTRRERFDLLRKFRAEQKLRRRRFKLEVKETWEAETAGDKENFSRL
jgi:hypothetical protein